VISIRCPRAADTASLGARLAAHLRPGDVVALCGPLGSGKTLFTGGVASGLGVEEPVTSPSFILARQYTSGFLPLTHADVYRLSTRNEFEDLDLIDDAVDGVLVIEWADAIEGTLPPDHLRIDFVIGDDDSRVVTLDGPPARWREMAMEFQV